MEFQSEITRLDRARKPADEQDDGATSSVRMDRNLASLSRRQFQQLLVRSVVHLDLKHRKLGFEIPRPFLRRFKRWKYRLHPAIDFQAKALGHHKVSAGDVAGLRLVRYRQRLFHGNSWVAPLLSSYCPPRWKSIR